jgi:hypothetical protein
VAGLDQNGMLSLNSPACDLLPAASIAITVMTLSPATPGDAPLGQRTYGLARG